MWAAELTNASAAVGVDQDHAMLEIARQRATQNASRFTWIQADAASVPLPDSSFDTVCESTLLCFQQNPEPILDEMVRLCRSGGTVVIGELNPLSPWQLWRRAKARLGIGNFRNAHWHTPQQLMRILEHTGCAPRFVGRAVFSIPIKRPNLAILRKVTDSVGERLWPYFGAYYVVAAEKP
jgi:ubiquinone/menaquinone biosynthesis C-methylase UbiE